MLRVLSAISVDSQAGKLYSRGSSLLCSWLGLIRLKGQKAQ